MKETDIYRYSMFVIMGLLLMTTASCRTSRKALTISRQDCYPYFSQYTDSMVCAPNMDSSYYLCQTRDPRSGPSMDPNRINAIMVIHCNTGKLVMNEEVPGSSARWVDAENIQVFSPSGFPAGNSGNTYNFNVISLKRTKAGVKNE